MPDIPETPNRMNLPLTQDPSSIYYIHPYDTTTAPLVTVKFDGKGFSDWKRAMLIILSTKNKLGFVNGSFTVPEEQTPEYKAWERCNDLVISWILANLDPRLAKSVMFFKTAKEVWDDLEERFGYASMAQVYSLQQKLSEMVQGNSNVSEFFTNLKTVWDEMYDAFPLPTCTCNKCTCNVTKKIHEREQQLKLLQ